MISYLRGEILQVQEDPTRVILLTNSGVGYSVLLPTFVRESVDPSVGQEVGLYIYYSVSERQPLPLLVGFENLSDREFFEQFIQVEGIGPTRAAAAMNLPVSTLAYAIEMDDVTTLTLMPGIGQRGAQKIVATLKGKVMEAARSPSEPSRWRVQAPDTRADVVAVLVNLGYRNAEAVALVDDALRRDPEYAEDPQRLLRDIFRNTGATAPVQ